MPAPTLHIIGQGARVRTWGIMNGDPDFSIRGGVPGKPTLSGPVLAQIRHSFGVSSGRLVVPGNKWRGQVSVNGSIIPPEGLEFFKHRLGNSTEELCSILFNYFS